MNNATTNTLITPEQVETILDCVYSYSRDHKYTGFNKHDALNSPLLRTLLGWGKWPRLLAIQTVMRSPINLRPWLFVKRTPNPKGFALFIQGLLYRYAKHKDPRYLKEAEDLIEQLMAMRSQGPWHGNCWGYQYPWQDLGFFAPPGTPNAVVTAFVCDALLDAYEVTHNTRYLETVESAIQFFLNDLLRLKNTTDEMCLSYMPLPMTMRVLDVSILIGAILARFSQYVNDDGYLIYASRLVRYVVNLQTPQGAWFYTDPPEDSPIRHDNYHTGFILDALNRYMESTDHWDWLPVYDRGLRFYANFLFNADGSPRWRSDCDFPHDIHGAAQGIITLARHEDLIPGLANKILDWSIMVMYDPEGRFYYQQGKHHINKTTLMRWCNAWMARAMAEWSLRQGR